MHALANTRARAEKQRTCERANASVCVGMCARVCAEYACPEATYPRKQSPGIMVTSNGYIGGRVLGVLGYRY